MILENTIKQASQLLKNHNINSHELDAEIILSDIMGVKKEFLIINSDLNISKKTSQKYFKAIGRRIKNEPVAYITGKKEFWSQIFKVDYSTLIPRPETELMIYKILSYFRNKKINILDMGTGSGCILLSILKELNLSRGTGIDVSKKAIKAARFNAKKLNLFYRAKFKICDISKFSFGKYDLIVSNPPYIPTNKIKRLSRDIVSYEPIVALNGGVEGLDLIKKVICKSKYLLINNGLLAIEIGNKQYFKVSNILKQNGFRELSRVCDYNNNVRCIISTKV